MAVFSAPALMCGARDHSIGWDRDVQFGRLHLVTNNSRFLIVPGGERNSGSRLLSLCTRRLVRDWPTHFGHRPLRRRDRCRVPIQAGCGAVPLRRSGEAGPVRVKPSFGQDPPPGVWPVRVAEPLPARGGQGGDFRSSGLHALLHDNPARTLSAWSRTCYQTGQQDPARIDEVRHKRWHHDIWEVGKWLGRVRNGWLNYFAVPGSDWFICTFHHRLQRLGMQALRRRSQRARFNWKRLERMSQLLRPRVVIRHPWPDQRFAVNHPR